MSVWDDLAGQEHAVEVLSAAVADAGRLLEQGAGVPVPRRGGAMSHAWLLTGPPGSGRSTAARAFAAALECPAGGDGTCHQCTTALGGTHPDVELVTTRVLSIGVDAARDLVARAGRRPSVGRWLVVVVEDADRMTEQAANALLKALEEPVERTVWLLCAPSLEDVLPTVRSRCRHLALRTPPTAAVAQVLVRRDGIDPPLADYAARASQGHIGVARRLARDEGARIRRHDVLRLAVSLDRLSDCLEAADELVSQAKREADGDSRATAEKESAELGRALGVGSTGRGTNGGARAAGALKELEKEQGRRAKRAERDGLDRSLVDLVSFYRDVLVIQLDAQVDLVNAGETEPLERLARHSTPEQTVRRMGAVLDCRTDLEGNVAPLLAAERMFVRLRNP